LKGLAEQSYLISKLKGEADEMQWRLHRFETGDSHLSCAHVLRCELEEALSHMQKEQSEVQQLQWWVLERQQREEEVKQVWRNERMLLRSELRDFQTSLTFPPLSTRSCKTNDFEMTLPVPAMASELDTKFIQRPIPIVAPFSREVCGVNISLSEDGYIATRTRGCRQSVVIGSEPLPRRDAGWYFEVEIRETVDGWVGGLGIGVTSTTPERLGHVPDKAWRVPHTFIIGYWGCLFLDGKEHRSKWRADTLKIGSRVGIHVTDGTGDLHVFTNDEPVVFVKGAVSGYSMIGNAGYYPIVDVFAATLSVGLNPKALPPPLSWNLDASHLSPPDSPVSRLSTAWSKRDVSD